MDHMPNEIRTYWHFNGNKYVGDWVDEKMNGNGVFTWFNGDQYEWRCLRILYGCLVVIILQIHNYSDDG